MGLAQIQEMLGALYTEPEVRDLFASDPESVGRAFRLSADEMSGCTRLSTQHVLFFARSLARKRLNSVKALLPRASRALGPELEQRYDDYRASVGGRLLPDSAVEARAFANYLIHHPANLDSVTRHLKDQVKVDRAELSMHKPGRRFAAELIGAPLEAVEDGHDARARPTLVIWMRVTAQGQMRRFSLRLL